MVCRKTHIKSIINTLRGINQMQGKGIICIKNHALKIAVRCTLYVIISYSYKYCGALHLYLLHPWRLFEATAKPQRGAISVGG
jgi:hypothetical protein